MRPLLVLAIFLSIGLSGCNPSDSEAEAYNLDTNASDTSGSDVQPNQDIGIDAGIADTGTRDDDTSGAFVANAGQSIRGIVGESITLDGSSSTGAVS